MPSTQALHRAVVAVVVMKVGVIRDDPSWEAPTEPIERYPPEPETQTMMCRGQAWQEQGLKGSPRVDPSPELREALHRTAILELLRAGAIVVAAGGGFGTPQGRRSGRICPARIRSIAAQGDLASSSMGPEVEAAARLVEQGRPRAGFTSLGLLDRDPVGQATPLEMPRLRQEAPAGRFVRLGPAVR